MRHAHRHTIVGLAVIIASLLGIVLIAQQSPRELFERARLLADSSQDLTEAVRLYGQVVEQAGGERALAATAQLRLGLLYERLGRTTDAQRAFGHVVRDYADQPEQVSAAQLRLAALTQPAGSTNATTMLTRRVWRRTGGGLGGSLTPDGRFLTFTDWTNGGDLAVRELATGTIRRLTDQRSTPEYHYAWSSAPSPDGRQVVFQWFDGDD